MCSRGCSVCWRAWDSRSPPLGLYGLIAQTGIERRREFGIRLALGAAGIDIVRLVTRYAVVVSSIGIVIGLSLSYFGTRLIQSMLFGVSPLDPAIYVVAVTHPHDGRRDRVRWARLACRPRASG